MVSDYQINATLQHANTIAIVGMSAQVQRPSNAVARYLQRNGYAIIPVNPHLSTPILGVQPVASLGDIRQHVDIVAIFRRPDAIGEFVDHAITIGADTVWMPFGVTNTAAATRAKVAGLTVIMDRCLAIEHRRLSRYADLVAA